jgi:hypothetical protein
MPQRFRYRQPNAAASYVVHPLPPYRLQLAAALCIAQCFLHWQPNAAIGLHSTAAAIIATAAAATICAEALINVLIAGQNEK